ncbi:biotin--[acetyl-CoA-carboxylase] ligase [Sulfurimonas sp. HSL-1716]|uniref:biotin--[acetyl-CoA-carboxylase] ligase n=1 Tax=Hydrocurvibacter sulfurireducens TaxID=3131937 RepID=UPI0031F8060B
MKIIYLEAVDSTQRYLKESLKKGELISPVAVTAQKQYDGQGSRGNSWIGEEGNLFFSFSIPLKDLPDDLRLESSSIYFSYLLKQVLEDKGSKVWLKWPNDFYIGDKKIGGTITNILKDDLICGIGLNLVSAPEGFCSLDVAISKENILNCYFNYLKKNIGWKHIFSKYKLEFDKSKNYFAHGGDKKVSLLNAILQEDGSIISDGQRIFSLR